MRKPLITMLAVAFLVLCLVPAMAAPPDKVDVNSSSDSVLTISKVSTHQVITYGWNLDAALVADKGLEQAETVSGNVYGSNIPTGALFQVRADQFMESNQLEVSVEAELASESNVDSVTVELGGIMDETFTVVETYQVSDFTLQTVEGVTVITLDVTADLLDLDEDELALLERVRLTIPAEKNNRPDLTAMHGLELPAVPKTVNARVDVQTDLLDVLAGFGSSDATEDDWNIDGNLFEEIPVIFNGAEDPDNMVVTVNLNGDEISLTETVNLTFGQRLDPPKEPATDMEATLIQSIWAGEYHPGRGSWMSPVKDNFVLGRQAVPVKFWVQEALDDTLTLQIFEGAVGDAPVVSVRLAAQISEDNQCSSKSHRAQVWGVKQPGAYYKFILKAQDLPALEEGVNYVLAVLVGDKMLSFGDEPAILSFSVHKNSAVDKQFKKQTLGTGFVPENYSGIGSNGIY